MENLADAKMLRWQFLGYFSQWQISWFAFRIRKTIFYSFIHLTHITMNNYFFLSNEDPTMGSSWSP